MSATGIITCYNHEAYIGEGIDSLAPQVDHLIVVDDHSTDGSVAVIEDRARTHSNVQVIRLERNVGPSAAFNAGARHASGEVLVLQGGDDLSLPGRVERQTALLDDADMVYSHPALIDQAGQRLPDSSGREFFPDLPSAQELLPTLFFIGNVVCAPSVSMRMDCFRRLGPFDDSLELVQDYLLWMKVAARGAVAFSPTRDIAYRKHPRNLSSRQESFDSPLNRRLAGEFGLARLRALESFGSEVLWTLLQRCNTAVPLQTPPADDLMRWLICVQHPSVVLRNAGLAMAAQGRVGEDDLREVAASPRDLFRELLVIADVENLHQRETLAATMRGYADAFGDRGYPGSEPAGGS